MSEILTEEEQIQAIKNWWKENGTQILMAACLIAIAYFGYNWWQNHQETQLGEASAAYEQYVEAVSVASASVSPTSAQIQTVDYLTDQLIEQHTSSHYAFLASLNTAALDVRRGDIESAATRLEWAQGQAESDADVQLVNYRYALVKAQLGNTDEALAMLSDTNEHFSSIYAEARGDIQLANGNVDAALADYEVARDTAALDEVNRARSIQVKIDSLLNGPGAVASAPE